MNFKPGDRVVCTDMHERMLGKEYTVATVFMHRLYFMEYVGQGGFPPQNFTLAKE